MIGDKDRSLLRVHNLTTVFDGSKRVTRAVGGLTFSVGCGERIAIVGESGSGKSVLAKSIVGLIDPPGRVSGEVVFDGQCLSDMPESALSNVRGDGISMVFQDAQSALNPVRSIGSQITEVLRLRGGVGRRTARLRARELLTQVGLGDPDLRLRQFPHQLSGGMNQRVMMAIAIASGPELMIADEPTTALDATTEAGILRLLSDLVVSRGMGLILISHDLGTVAALADRVLVMYAGRLVEEGTAEDVLLRPQHPYTQGLLAASAAGRRGRDGPTMRGSVPDLAALPAGCAFQPRCSNPSKDSDERCATVVPVLSGGATPGHAVACYHAGPARAQGKPTVQALSDPMLRPAGSTVKQPLLRVDGLVKRYPVGGHLFAQHGGIVHAVDDVSFAVERGATFALIGESGSGKTTTARLVLGLERPDAGTIQFDGIDTAGLRGRELHALRRRMQVVFQSPERSLDPLMSVGDVIAEPLLAHGMSSRPERMARAAEVLDQVGLQPRDLARYPREFSGGQQQRISIARALAPSPELIVCDEPVTALDVSVRAQILRLLRELQARHEIAYLMIAHDLSVVEETADRVAVMYLGQIVETALAKEFFSSASHPYSLALLSARRRPDPIHERSRQRIVLGGSQPSATSPPTGCRFHTRCWKAQALCQDVPPKPQTLRAEHQVACHFPETDASSQQVLLSTRRGTDVDQRVQT